MRLNDKVQFGLAAIFLLFSLSGQAVVHEVSGGKLTGATGVDVGGTLYNVEFLDGTFDSVFSSVIPDFHNTNGKALLFAQALDTQVFQNVGTDPTTAFDSTPALTSGCTVTFSYCQVGIPFDAPMFGPDQYVQALEYINYNGNIADVDNQTNYYKADDDYTAGWRTYARFSVASVSAVPEPSAYAMLLAGLMMLGGISASRRNRL